MHGVRAIWAALCTIVALAGGLAGTATAAVPADLKLVSSYPATGGWSLMWTGWSEPTLDADFARVAGLGANAVRVIIPARTFGFPIPNAEMTNRLEATVDIADRHGLRVELTLFDLMDPYGDVLGSRLWSTALLAPFAGDPRVAAIEVKNEVDPANPAVIAWARELIPHVRSVGRGIPVTISTREGVERLRLLRDGLAGAAPDFYSYHYYAAGDPSRAYAELAAAKSLVAPAPVFLAETGASTWTGAAAPGAPQSLAAREAEQAHYFRTLGLATRALGLAPPAPWTLNDFLPGAIPREAGVGENPAEYELGLFRTDGSEKPAAAAVREMFADAPVDPGFNEGFEDGVPAASGSLPALWRAFAPEEGRFARDERVARSGRASARLARTRGRSNAVPAFLGVPPGYAPVAGKPCQATVFARGRKSTGLNRVALAWFDADRNYLGQAESRKLRRGTTKRWRRLVAQGVTPDTAAYVQIHLKSSKNKGRVWFDDVRFAC